MSRENVRVKAADISTEAMVAAIRRDSAERWAGYPEIVKRLPGGVGPACTQTIAEREGWPVKVAMAKLRGMERRGLVDGCACGCRGDWTIA